MARLVWMVLCSKTSIDQRSNNVSIFEVIEQLTVEKIPADQEVSVPLNWEVAILCARSDAAVPEQHVGRLIIVMPSGKRAEAAQFEIRMTGEHRRIRNTIQSNTFLLHGPGIYEFVLEYRSLTGDQWQEAGRIPLDVMFQTAQ